jgi:hemoglobin-like flavoprotein
MTPDQIRLVRSSWPIVITASDTLAIHFYSRLFEIDDSAARLFADVDMVLQRQKLTKSLDVVVNALDDPDQLLPAVAALGKRHTKYGVEHHHFDSVGESLIVALGATLRDEFTAELQAAWTEAYALVSSVMRRALIRASVPS